MKLLEQIKPQIDKHAIISFDIFDTLLLRPYVQPTDLFLHLEYLEKVEGFKKDRIDAEKIARQLHKEKEDVSIDDIYNELEEPFFSLKSKELELERKTLFSNPEIKEVFDYAKKYRKKIIIVSDMYLSQQFLENVLKEKGFSGYNKLYLSSQLNKTKWNGTLYEHILKDLKVSGSKILHIGDNEKSDVLMAKKYRITPHHYSKVFDRLFQENNRVQEFYKNHRDDLGASILLGVMAIYNLCPSNKYWENFGFKYGGPVVYGYMQWLSEQLIKDDIHEAMFVARDGYTLQKVFDIVKQSKVSTHYYYAPRIINLVSNLNYKTYMDINEEGGMVALRAVLAYFKNKDSFLAQNTPDIKTCAEGDAFIKEYKDLYEKLAKNEQKNYQNYFKPFNIRDKRVALIDTCSSMLSAQKSLMIGLPDKDIKGYYWMTWEGTQKDISKYKTATFQQSHRQEFLDWNIMELYMTAPTPPADKIENGKVIFKKINPNEMRRIEIYPNLSKGMVNYANFVNTIFGKLNLFLNDRILIDWTNVLCKIPTPKDRMEFKSIQHAWDIEHTNYIPLPAPWFKKSLQPLTKSYTKKWIRLFNCIPLFKKEIKNKKIKFYLFNLIPILTNKHQTNTRTIKFLGILPLLKIKYVKNNNSEYDDTYVYLFGFIPFLKTKKEFNLFNKEKTKVYLGNIRLFTIKRSIL